MYKSFVVLLLLLVTLTSFASITPENSHAKPIKFCFSDWFPYAHLDKNKQATGSTITFLQQSLKSLKTELYFEQLPHKRCLEKVKQGAFDFIVHVDQSEPITLLKHPLAYWDLTFAVRGDSKLTMNDILQGHQLPLLIARDYNYPDKLWLKLSKLSPQISKSSFYTDTEEDISKIFTILAHKRVDAILVDKAWAQAKIDQYQLPVKIVDGYIHREPQFLGYNNNNAALAVQVKQVLAQKN